MKNVLKFPTAAASENPWDPQNIPTFIEANKSLWDAENRPVDEAVWAINLLKYGHVRNYHDALWGWNGTAFRPVEAEIRRFLILLFGKTLTGNASSRFVNRVMEAVEMAAETAQDENPPWPEQRGIPFQNGWLNLENLELERHDPKHGNRHVFPVEWKIEGIPKATQTFVEDFLQSTFADDPAKIPVVLAFIGYAMSPDLIWEKSLFLLGNGRNGKGTLISMASAMFGDAAAEMDLEELATDRFARAELADRRLMIASDLGEANLRGQTGLFKRLTAFETIPNAQRKYGMLFRFRNEAKLILAANSLPRSSDHAKGYYERFLPVLFNQYFDPQSPDAIPDLKKRLTTPDALSYLAFRAVTEYLTIYPKLPALPKDSVEALAAYTERDDLVAAALGAEGCFDRDETGMPTRDAYEAFREWATAHGYAKIPPQSKFTERLRQLDVSYRRTPKQRIVGLKLRP